MTDLKGLRNSTNKSFYFLRMEFLSCDRNTVTLTWKTKRRLWQRKYPQHKPQSACMKCWLPMYLFSLFLFINQTLFSLSTYLTSLLWHPITNSSNEAINTTPFLKDNHHMGTAAIFGPCLGGHWASLLSNRLTQTKLGNVSRNTPTILSGGALAVCRI